MSRLIDADELITAFPCGETVRTECVRATIIHMPTIEERKSTIEFPHVFIAEGYDSIKSEDGETGFGVYDPENKQIFIAGAVPDEIFVKALLHELMHWGQDISGCAFNEGEANTFAENIYNTMESYIVTSRWIPCSERLPECEQEVLICTEKKVYVSKKTGMEWYKEPVITPALYEDGTMLEVNSKWRWEDIDYAGWDDEEDCGIIPEGWWENRHFNPDEVYNNVVDRKVIAWMPLPEPYEERREE